MIPIYTSRYQNQAAIIASNLAPVRITRWPPRFRLGYTLAGYVEMLAPSKWMFGIDDDEEFRRAYTHQLDGWGVEMIERELSRLVENAGARGAVVLCYEDVLTKGEHCHRRDLSEWWYRETGDFIAELGMTTQQIDAELSRLVSHQSG